MQVLKAIWNFLQNQILGMNWLNDVIGNGLSALGLDIGNRWVASVQFFIYDTIKIVFLLCRIGATRDGYYNRPCNRFLSDCSLRGNDNTRLGGRWKRSLLW